MKIDKAPSAVSAVDPQTRRQPVRRELAEPDERPQAETGEGGQSAFQGAKRAGGYSVQLNRQLTSMQSAERFLVDLGARLRQLKLALSQQISAGRQGLGRSEHAIRTALDETNALLEDRSGASAGSLDASLRLSLNEPVRTRFSIDALTSPEQLRAAGSETLVFRLGNMQAEPMVVAIDESSSDEQILRRFNTAFAPAGMRAELDVHGNLRFSIRETDWQRHGGRVGVQGEGGLLPSKAAFVAVHEERLLDLPALESLDSEQSMRSLLDAVVKTLDRIARLEDQIAQRKNEIRAFLARHTDADEQRWAQDYAQKVFGLMQGARSDYAAVTQAVVSQANLNRFAVVSLLS